MSKVIVSPTEPRPTHDISLTDGKQTVGLIICDAQGNHNARVITRTPLNRTAMKTTSGNQSYNDYEPPWTPVAQEDWSGGRGLEDFDKDVTRYQDGYRCNASMAGRIIMGGLETYSSGLINATSSLPGSVSWSALTAGGKLYLANKIIPASNYTLANLGVIVKRVGTPAGALTIALYSNGAGVPGTSIASASVSTSDITDTISGLFEASVSTSLTSGITYWVVVTAANGTETDHWRVGVNNATGTSYQSVNGSSWAISAVDLYYHAREASATKTQIFFQYRNCLYLVVNDPAGAAPSLYINGDHGTADANTGALTTLVDATKTWTVNQWAGWKVKLIRGTGLQEATPWRTIISNTTTTLTLDTTWTITHDTTTEYSIMGGNVWTLVTGHGLATIVTDILVVNDMVYFAMGDATNIRRMKWYNTAGAESLVYADDGTNMAVFLETVRDTGGVMAIWRGQNKDATGLVSVSKATVVDWGTNLTFAASLAFKDQWGKINGMKEFINELWIGREGTVYAASGTIIDEIKLDEIHTAMESSNCQTMMTSNAYLYFNLGAGIERYLSGAMDDVGPNRDMGLPSDRQGVISSLVAYQGRYFAAVNGDNSNYSSILMFNGTGWTEIYRAPTKGLRITAMAFQTVPGAALDRLWFNMGTQAAWIPFPSMTVDPTHDSNYVFTYESTITSGYIYCGMVDAFKFFKSIKIFTENLSTDKCWIEAEYRVDNDTAWTAVAGVMDVSPMSGLDLQQYLGVMGKRIQYRLHLITTDKTISPKIKAIVVENVSKVPIKYSYTFQYRAQDGEANLRDEPEGTSADDKQDLLDAWAENLTPLMMNSTRVRFDGKLVFIDPADLTPLAEHSAFYAPRLTLVAV